MAGFLHGFDLNHAEAVLEHCGYQPHALGALTLLAKHHATIRCEEEALFAKYVAFDPRARVVLLSSSTAVIEAALAHARGAPTGALAALIAPLGADPAVVLSTDPRSCYRQTPPRVLSSGPVHQHVPLGHPYMAYAFGQDYGSRTATGTLVLDYQDPAAAANDLPLREHLLSIGYDGASLVPFSHMAVLASGRVAGSDLILGLRAPAHGALDLFNMYANSDLGFAGC